MLSVLSLSTMQFVCIEKNKSGVEDEIFSFLPCKKTIIATLLSIVSGKGTISKVVQIIIV